MSGGPPSSSVPRQAQFILQIAVPVLSDDTVAALSARILGEEHRLYPEAIQIVLDGRWTVEGRRFRQHG